MGCFCLQPVSISGGVGIKSKIKAKASKEIPINPLAVPPCSICLVKAFFLIHIYIYLQGKLSTRDATPSWLTIFEGIGSKLLQ